MAKRKKTIRSSRIVRRHEPLLRNLMPHLKLKEHTAREVEAILIILLAGLFLLSLIGRAGAVGFYINEFLRTIFGVGVWLIPMALAGFSWVLFRVPNFNVTFARVFGAGMTITSFLGLVHLRVPTQDLLKIAQIGESGGYVGFTVSWLLKNTFGPTASALILFCTLVIGLLITFDVSISKIVLAIKWFFDTAPEGEKYVPLNQSSAQLNQWKQSSVKGAQSSLPEVSLRPEDMKPTLKVHINAPGAERELLKQKKREVKEKIDNATDFKPRKLKSTIQWKFPSIELLDDSDFSVAADKKVIDANVRRIQETLANFDIPVTMGEVNVGPTVTQYTFKPAEGIKLSRITTLQNDLALALAAESLRCEAPIPGKSLVGLELPNKIRSDVCLRGIMASEKWKKMKGELKIAIGRNVNGEPMLADLATMPHLLIAGATGSGKSVCMNSLLVSLLFQRSPDELRMILIDPKRVELTLYNGIPHLLTPVIAEPEKTVTALRWVVAEMNRRYKVLEEAGDKNIQSYNGHRKADEPLMPFILVVIDELADIMLVASKEVEALICRLAQMARAVGIHLVIATQRPSVDVVTGLIKANFPTRVAFAVTSGVDSRTIIDMHGAEKLLGRGDMLYMTPSISKPVRLQGVYLSPEEIKRVASEVKLTMEPEYVEEIIDKKREIPSGLPGAGTMGMLRNDDENDDAVEKQALEVIITTGRASASLLQRRLRLGYARAARVLDLLEEKGYIGPSQGAKPRDIYITKEKLTELGIAVAVVAEATLASGPVDMSAHETPEEVDNEEIPDWE